MQVEGLVRITIGEAVHEITMDDARGLMAQLAGILHPPVHIKFPDNAGMSDSEIDRILGNPAPMWRTHRPIDFTPKVYCETDSDGSPI